MSVLSISKNSLYKQVGKFLKTPLKSFQDANLWTNRYYEIGGPSFSLFNRWNIQMRLLIWQQILKTSCHWLLSAIQLAWKVNIGECWPDYNSGAPWVKKCGKLPIRENLVITWPYTDRPPARPTDRPSAPQAYQCKIIQLTGMATQMQLKVLFGKKSHGRPDF